MSYFKKMSPLTLTLLLATSPLTAFAQGNDDGDLGSTPTTNVTQPEITIGSSESTDASDTPTTPPTMGTPTTSNSPTTADPGTVTTKESGNGEETTTQSTTPPSTVPTPPPYYPPVLEPEPSQPVQIVTTETPTTTVENTGLPLDAIMASSINNGPMKAAYTDFAYALNSFVLNDESEKELIGSAFDEVKTGFETHLQGAQRDDVEVASEGQLQEMGKAKSLTYTYFYPGEVGDNSKVIGELTFHFDNDKLSAVSLLNKAPIVGQFARAEVLNALPGHPDPKAYMAEQNLTVIGITTKVKEGYRYYNLITPQEAEGNKTYAVIQLYQEDTKVVRDLTDNINQIILTYLDSTEPRASQNADYIAQEGTASSAEATTTEGGTSGQETSVASEATTSAEITTVTTEPATTQAGEVATTQAGEAGNMTILQQLPLNFDYDKNQLSDEDTLLAGFDVLLKRFQDGNTLKVADLDLQLGKVFQVRDENPNLRLYIAITDKQITLIQALLDENQAVMSLKREVRTEDVLGKFPITVDDLYAIGQSKEGIQTQLQAKVGVPTIVEIQNQEGTVRYVWTRLQDTAIKNIEVQENEKDGSQGLVYYAP